MQIIAGLSHFTPPYYTAAACKSDPHDCHTGHTAVQVYEATWGIVFNLVLNQVIPKIQLSREAWKR